MKPMKAKPLTRVKAALGAFCRRLRADRQGNMLVIAVVSIIPIMLATGFGIDYTRAQAAQTALNGIADAAALAATDAKLISQSDSAAITAAQKVFNAQAATITTVTNLTMNTPTVVDGTGTRKVTVSYTAQTRNLFSSIIGLQTLPITGTATAIYTPPTPLSTNLYVVVDTSPSMTLAATSAGIARMQLPKGQGGADCAFACHVANVIGQGTSHYGSADVWDSNYNTIVLGHDPYTSPYVDQMMRLNPWNNIYDANGNNICNISSASADGVVGYDGQNRNSWFVYCNVNYGRKAFQITFADPWYLARNYGAIYPNSGITSIQTRLDSVGPALSALVASAQSGESTGTVYNLSVSTLDRQFGSGGAPIDVASISPSSFSDTGSWAISPTDMINDGRWGSVNNQSGAFTYFPNMFAYIANGKLFNINALNGNGTSANPNNLLIIVTDGMENTSSGNIGGSWMYWDPYWSGFNFSPNQCDPTGGGVDTSGNIDWYPHYCGPLDGSNIGWCNYLKSKGLKIGIVDLQYPKSALLNTYNNSGGVWPIQNNQTGWNVSYLMSSSPYLDTLTGGLAACATQFADGTSLMETVPIDGDTTAAMTNIFNKVTNNGTYSAGASAPERRAPRKCAL